VEEGGHVHQRQHSHHHDTHLKQDASYISLLARGSCESSTADADVVEENKQAMQYLMQSTAERDVQCAMVVAETTYFYPLSSSKLGRSSDEGGIWALRGISLSLKLGECFGLLGRYDV
jgi:ABC-type glutathione transport system ATPase component